MFFLRHSLFLFCTFPFYTKEKKISIGYKYRYFFPIEPDKSLISYIYNEGLKTGRWCFPFC